jgi:chemotaxis protein CheX
MTAAMIVLDPPPRQIDLPDSLGSAAARPLADELLAARGAPLTLGAGSVRRLGAQCVQVMLSAAATWRADGFALGIDSPTPEFHEALRLLGLSVEAVTAHADSGGDASK